MYYLSNNPDLHVRWIIIITFIVYLVSSVVRVVSVYYAWVIVIIQVTQRRLKIVIIQVTQRRG